MDRQRTTPGLGGYLLAYAVSIGCFATVPVLVAAAMVVPDQPEAIGGIAAALVVYLVYSAVFSVPFALVGMPVVHLLSRHCETQSAQVLITGAVTFAVVGLPLATLDDDLSVLGLLLGGGAALATTIGRASVIPLVPHPRLGDSRPRERQRP